MVLFLLSAWAGELETHGPEVETQAPDVVEPESDGIINGQPANEDDWPMTGGLLVTGTAELPVVGELTGRLLMCSATLIAPDVVLLAAHCVDVDGVIEQAASQIGFEIEIRDLEFAFSRQSDLSMYGIGLSGPEPYPEDAVVAWDYTTPEEWDINALEIGLNRNYDIALLFLEEPILDVPFAIVATEEEKEQMEVGTSVQVVGWGQQDQNPQAPDSVGYKQMGQSYVAEMTAAEFKVGHVAEDVRKCHGDSGGPSFMEVETESSETWRIVGVTSHAYDNTDCRETGGVDTRISAYLDWIDAEMTARCESAERAWCEVPGLIPPPDAAGLFPWDQEDVALVDEEEALKQGCGCSSSPAGLSVLPILLALGWMRRRE